MSRRERSFFEDVIAAPWWVGVLLAIVSYLGLRFLPPAFEITNPLLKGILGALPSLAPVFAFAFLVCAILAALDAWRKGALFDRQTDIRSIRLIGWREFEELIGEAYRWKGFRVTETGGGGADGGVDLEIRKDGQTVLVQCKHWRVEQVGVRIVRELYGVVAAQGATGGIVISSGTFTREAREFASGKQLELIDGPGLVMMISEVKNARKPGPPRVTEPAVGRECPLCGSGMVLRTAGKGLNEGRKFWGCAAFPKCRGTREYSG